MSTRTKRIIVEVWEHDSWSGCSLFTTRSYKHRHSARRYVNQINGENSSDQVPSTYYTANIKGEGGPMLITR